MIPNIILNAGVLNAILNAGHSHSQRRYSQLVATSLNILNDVGMCVLETDARLYTCAYVCAYLCVYTCVCMCVYLCVYTCVCMCVCMCVHVCVCVCVHMCVL